MGPGGPARDRRALHSDGLRTRRGTPDRAHRQPPRDRVSTGRLVPPESRRGAQEREPPRRGALRSDGTQARARFRRRRGRARGGRARGGTDQRGRHHLAHEDHIRRPGGRRVTKMDMNKMLQQVQQMQEEMAKAQDELANEVVEASVGGGMVKVKASGAGEITEITISPDVIDPEDPEGLADLILAGVNQALKNSQDLMQSKLGGAMGGLKGLGLPGL